MYCKYCGEEIGNSKYCPNCGHKQEQDEVIVTDDKGNEDVNNINENNINEPEVNENKISDSIKSKDSKKKSTKNNTWVFILLGIAIALVISVFSDSEVTDDEYIGCAETIILDGLKSPSTAKFSEGKVLEKDSYGRALVTLTVDAQNSFGAYLRNKYALVIESYDKKTGEFTYRKNCIVDLDDGDLLKFTVEYLKQVSNWDEPLND